MLGSPYTEVMIGGDGSYGGAPGKGAVKVGDAYWVSFLVSILGNHRVVPRQRIGRLGSQAVFRGMTSSVATDADPLPHATSSR